MNEYLYFKFNLFIKNKINKLNLKLILNQTKLN